MKIKEKYKKEIEVNFLYLKALEIQGFKSFPDRTVLPFGEAITAVVGPNGSGKSNISDAIRWVVGEQKTKNLRGGKMEDVIFGGTEKRKQTSFAQVSLVMDNSQRLFDMDETEVMVTRKYYRSGDSEYFINKHKVLLRDINEFFMGTGLGNEGYAVIGQGKIDEILSVRSSERRKVFEEAAGIAKYRHQKEESEKKLGRAQENLLRIEDKIAELELQVIPLQQQSETAKKFLIFRDELRSLEISLWLEQLAQVQTNKIKLHADFNVAVGEKDKANAELEALYQKVEKLGEEMRQKSMDGERLRTDLTKREGEVAEEEAQITVLQNNISNNESNAKRLSESLEQKQAREEDLKNQIAQQEEQLLALEDRRASISEGADAKKQIAHNLELQVGEQSKSLETLRQSETAQTASVSEAKAQLSALTSSTQEIFDQDESLRLEISGLDIKIQAEKQQLAEQESKHKEAIEGKASATNTVEGYALRVSGRQEKLDKLRQQQEALDREIHIKESKSKLLTDMEQSYEGFSHSVKKVMNASKNGQLQNVYGPVADLITVPQEFTVAIETALGGAMHNIVVANPQDGKAAIEFLNRTNGGRVTVAPLSTTKPRFLSQANALQNETGFVGIASDLLQFDPIFAPLIGNQLGNVAIMENLSCAMATAKKFNFQFRIVTLDGQVQNAGGFMTGGSKNKSAGILSRKGDIEKLKEELSEHRLKLGTLDQEKADIATLVSGDQYQLDIAKNELRQFEDDILKWEGACSSSRRGLEGLQSQLDQRQQQLSQLKDRSEKIESSTKEAQEHIQSQEASVQQLKEQYSQEAETLGRLQEQWQQARDLSAQLTTQMEGLIVEENALLQGKSNLEQILRDVLGERAESSTLIQDYTEKNKEYDSQIQGKLEEIGERRKVCDKLREDIKTLEQEKLSLEALRVQTDKDSREKNNQLINFERSAAGLEQKKSLAESEEAQILGRLWETYELTHEGAKQQQIELESVAKATRRIGELKRDISALGNINVGAIDEFEKINERYTYFTDQRDDIGNAKKELEKIIADIVKEMEEIFATEFARINEAFGEIFVKLFGGGGAEVILEESGDVLGSGIEIKAQPPGKALKIISLLSGGEKALVAIALYFAILRIRPCPFVVMDEIEAALDDSNIERFVRYVRQISDKTQFIIITHRRGSMEAADILYGITMQEKGVSRMLRLNLNEVEKELNMKI